MSVCVCVCFFSCVIRWYFFLRIHKFYCPFFFQVWVLTGDKEETAVNISFSAGHFAPGLPTIRITQQANLRDCVTSVNRQIERIQEVQNIQPNYTFGLVIDGQSLNYALTVG